MMIKDTKNKIEVWLKDLGYTFNKKLYSPVAKMSYCRPSYRIMASTVLHSIKDSNPEINSKDAWIYTTKFVDGMKSNMISNNNYFQNVLRKELYNPLTNKQDTKVNLIKSNMIKNSKYNYLKNIRISNGEESRIFDFLIVINGFPLILIEVIDKINSSFENSFLKLEENFNKYPMFFNFNKLILLTDGYNYKLGGLYDFPEEYINFNDSMVENNYEIKYLEEILSRENILNILKKSIDNKQIYEYINEKLNREDAKRIENKNSDVENKFKQENEEENLNILEEDEELSLLADIFNPNLDEVLKSEDFKKKLENTKEVQDFKENRSYIEDIQKNKNMETMETLIKANERLILKEVNRYIRYQTSSMDFDDLYQLGCIGLLKALKRFDLKQEYEFSTYAIYWIRQTIIKGINNESLVIRIPAYQWELFMKLSKLETRSEIQFNKVDYEWISKELNMTMEKLLEVLKIRNTFMNNISLDSPVGIDGDTKLGEFIADEDHNIEEIILNMDLRDKLEDMLEILDDRSKDIIIKRFGLDGQAPMSLQEIGDIYNISRERVRQIENQSLNKLKHPSRIKKIKDYHEG